MSAIKMVKKRDADTTNHPFYKRTDIVLQNVQSNLYIKGTQQNMKMCHL